MTLAEQTSNRERILLVEDEPLVARLFQREAEAARFIVDVAATSAEADALEMERTYDAVVSDIHLPGENGIDFVERLLARRPSLPVLFVTGDQDISIPEREPLDRVQGVIIKPWNHGEVGRALARCFSIPDSGFNGTDSTTRTLLIEDNIDDVVLFEEALSQAGLMLSLECVERLSIAEERLSSESWDLVVADLTLPDGRGIDAVRSVVSHCGETPLLVLTGTDSAELAAESVRLGAQDYLLKDELTGTALSRAIHNAFERKRTQGELFRLAHYDSLTSIGNRHFFRSRLRHALRRSQRNGSGLAVLFVDLDAFKAVNDQHGHDAGDRVLQEVARRLEVIVRDSDSVSRLGGDEFAVLLERVDCDQFTEEIANRILDSLLMPFDDATSEVRVGASVGIARFPRDGQTVDDLLTYSDRAMYAAKARGGGHVQVRTPIVATGRTPARKTLEQRLLRAHEDHEFELFFQPQVQIETGTVLVAEGLLRWRTSGGQLIPASRFVRALEETHLIESVGEWVLGQACDAAASWHDQGHRVNVSVNVAPKQILAPGFVETVSTALSNSTAPASSLELEITESAVLTRPKSTLSRFESLRELGCSLAIDDFGTGYSSLSYLERYPFSVLKIDRELVENLEESKRARTLVRSVTELGHNLDLLVVGEGVDTPGKFELLDSWACDRSQGYLHAQPLQADAFMDFLDSQPSVPRRS